MRKQVSIREFLAASGAVVDKMEEANGSRYTLRGVEDTPDEYQFGENEYEDRFFAIFGHQTKIGNVANTVLNDKDDPGTPTEARGAIRDFRTMVQGGNWTEPARGASGGAKIDRDTLAMAIVEVYTAINEAKGKPAPDMLAIRQRLDDDKEFFAAMSPRSAKGVVAVKEAYERLAGKPAVTPVAAEDIDV